MRRRITTRRAVLGIDAAWTVGQPSGVALVVERGGGWACAAVAPSYGDLERLAAGGAVDWDARTVPGGTPDVGALLDAARRLAPGAEVVAIAVDMPLALRPIRARRGCDDAFSRAFARRGLGVHSPSARRPGSAGRSGFCPATRRGMTDFGYIGCCAPAGLIIGYSMPPAFSSTGGRAAPRPIGWMRRGCCVR